MREKLEQQAKLIGRLQATVDILQKEAEYNQMAFSQNALCRRVAELTNERNALQGVWCELNETKRLLLLAQETLAQYGIRLNLKAISLTVTTGNGYEEIIDGTTVL